MKNVLIRAVEFAEAAVMWLAIALTAAIIVTAMFTKQRPVPYPQHEQPAVYKLDRSIT